MPQKTNMEEIKVYLSNSTTTSDEMHTQPIPLILVPTCGRCDDMEAQAKVLEGKTWSYLLQYHRELILLETRHHRSLATNKADDLSIEVDPCHTDLDDLVILPDAMSYYLANMPICHNCETTKAQANKTQELLLGKSKELLQQLMTLRKERLSPPMRIVTPVQQRIQDLEELRLQKLMASVTPQPVDAVTPEGRRSFHELEAAVDSLDNAFGQLLRELQIIDCFADARDADIPAEMSHHIDEPPQYQPAHSTGAKPRHSVDEFLLGFGDVRHQAFITRPTNPGGIIPDFRTEENSVPIQRGGLFPHTSAINPGDSSEEMPELVLPDPAIPLAELSGEGDAISKSIYDSRLSKANADDLLAESNEDSVLEDNGSIESTANLTHEERADPDLGISSNDSMEEWLLI